MADKNNVEECKGLESMRQTDKDIKDIRGLIGGISEDSAINANSLKFMSESFKAIAGETLVFPLIKRLINPGLTFNLNASAFEPMSFGCK